MLPHNGAELAIAELKGSEAPVNLKVLSSTAELLGGEPAEYVLICYKNERGLPIECVVVALVDAQDRP